MPRSDGARPPPGRPPHVGVVERHGRIEPKDPAALRRESDAELALPGDQILAIAPDGLQRVHPDERIAPQARLTDRRIPLHIAEQVVHGGLGMTLAAPTADHGPLAVEQAERATSIHLASISQSPSTNCTSSTSGQTFLSRSRPALRARAAVKGIDVSRSTTSAPMDRAIATLSSLEPEST